MAQERGLDKYRENPQIIQTENAEQLKRPAFPCNIVIITDEKPIPIERKVGNYTVRYMKVTGILREGFILPFSNQLLRLNPSINTETLREEYGIDKSEYDLKGQRKDKDIPIQAIAVEGTLGFVDPRPYVMLTFLSEGNSGWMDAYGNETPLGRFSSSAHKDYPLRIDAENIIPIVPGGPILASDHLRDHEFEVFADRIYVALETQGSVNATNLHTITLDPHNVIGRNLSNTESSIDVSIHIVGSNQGESEYIVGYRKGGNYPPIITTPGTEGIIVPEFVEEFVQLIKTQPQDVPVAEVAQKPELILLQSPERVLLEGHPQSVKDLYGVLAAIEHGMTMQTVLRGAGRGFVPSERSLPKWRREAIAQMLTQTIRFSRDFVNLYLSTLDKTLRRNAQQSLDQYSVARNLLRYTQEFFLSIRSAEELTRSQFWAFLKSQQLITHPTPLANELLSDMYAQFVIKIFDPKVLPEVSLASDLSERNIVENAIREVQATTQYNTIVIYADENTSVEAAINHAQVMRSIHPDMSVRILDVSKKNGFKQRMKELNEINIDIIRARAAENMLKSQQMNREHTLAIIPLSRANRWPDAVKQLLNSVAGRVVETIDIEYGSQNVAKPVANYEMKASIVNDTNEQESDKHYAARIWHS